MLDQEITSNHVMKIHKNWAIWLQKLNFGSAKNINKAEKQAKWEKYLQDKW